MLLYIPGINQVYTRYIYLSRWNISGIYLVYTQIMLDMDRTTYE